MNENSRENQGKVCVANWRESKTKTYREREGNATYIGKNREPEENMEGEKERKTINVGKCSRSSTYSSQSPKVYDIR